MVTYKDGLKFIKDRLALALKKNPKIVFKTRDYKSCPLGKLYKIKAAQWKHLTDLAKVRALEDGWAARTWDVFIRWVDHFNTHESLNKRLRKLVN